MKLIDADAFSNVMKKRQDACSEWVKEAKGNYRYRALGAWSILSEIKLTLDKMPTIDAVEVKHGKWIEADDLEGAIKGRVVCSNCKNPFESIVMTNEKIILTNQKTKYCPNCGAKMDGEVKSDG